MARASNLPRPRVDDGLCWIDVPACDGDPAGALEAAFSPSTDWEVGGPIIEREQLSVLAHWGEWKAAYEVRVRYIQDDGSSLLDTENTASALGPTPLIAAMRAYVTKKIGRDVEEMPGAAP